MIRRALTTVVVALAFGAPSTLHAQSKDELANADALFNAAKALLEAGQYNDACGKFAESKRLAPGLGVTLYLADCYEHIGRTASAWTEFRAAEGLARARNDQRADVARGRAQALEPKLNRLTVVVAPIVPRVGLRILLDGAPIASEEWGLAMAMDPGDHVVVVSAPEHPNRSFAAHLSAETPSATIRVDSLTEAPTLGAAPVNQAPLAQQVPGQGVATEATPRDEGETTDPGSIHRWVGIGVGALGVVGVGVGSIFGLVAQSKLSQSNQPGHCDPTDHCTRDGLALRKDAADAATASSVFFVAGGVALAAGIVVYLTAPHRSSATAWILAPAAMPGGGGGVLHGTF